MTAPADFLSPGSQFPPAPHGSTSTVRSDATPAAPLPTCANCGSNLIEPAPAHDAVREAAERLRAAIAKHKTGCNCDACDSGEDLLAALDARRRG